MDRFEACTCRFKMLLHQPEATDTQAFTEGCVR